MLMRLIANENSDKINLFYHFKRSYGHFPRHSNNSAVILDSSTSYTTVNKVSNHLLMSAFIGMGVLGLIAITAIIVNIYYIWTSSRSGHHLKKKAITRLSTHPRASTEEHTQPPPSPQQHHHIPHRHPRQSYVTKPHDVDGLSQNWNNDNVKGNLDVISDEAKLKLANTNKNNHSENTNKDFINLLDNIFSNLENPKLMMEKKLPQQPIIVGGPVVREEMELNWILK